MDDDGWGSPWANDASTTSTFKTTSTGFTTPAADEEDGFDDFGDVQTPGADITTGAGGDDDFGDFGDFDEGPQEGFAGDAAFEDQARLAGPSHWDALVLDPLPSRAELQEKIEDILAPLWAYDDVSSALSDEPMREIGGLAQVLVTPESRALYQNLLSSPPLAGPVNWTRSRVRRQHLIALGIPVNLDEVLPHAGGKPMPALQITTRPMSAPPGARPGHHANGSASAGGSRRGSPAPRGPAERLGLGPKPSIDEPKIEHLLSLKYDQLSLLPLPQLEKHLADMRAQTAATSSLLTYTLQTRDALQQDSEMYNKLIGELIGEAQKQKTGKSLSRGPSRRGTMQ
ncbi:hypothetical protein PENSPDRAFT_599007 [Peniophora sp. CONT]|nr:hypothetical protein PENSPDRAFT_599007 [Peniophora sp. CONT]